ncbi:MAG TPA: molybdopterin cofactor-binding domain-containing protein [Acetobacteraceae bacterium]|nr:molybdopterin cofactor-binding domain-containing protein [Acetobacteraceae bacterium]
MLHDRPDPSPASTGGSRGLSRRTLLGAGAAVGGGLLLGIELIGGRSAEAKDPRPQGGATFNAFVRIARDGAITMIMPAVEMGQGTYTMMATLIAEELDVDLAQVTVEHAPPDQKDYGNPIFVAQITGGSTSTMGWYLPLRKAGATARAMLVGAAAAGWNVDPASLRTESGVVHHDASGRSAPYGRLADRAAAIPAPKEPILKDPKSFRLIGKPLKRIDTPDKVNGKVQYGIDVMLPGMKFGTLAACPVFGGKVRHVDDSQARAVPGVRQVVVLDDLVAVVGDHMWAAKQGLAALAIDWDYGPNAHAMQEDLYAAQAKAANGSGVTAQKVGDAPAHLKDGTVYEDEFELPYLAHAPMEPINGTAHFKGDSCEIWVGTQAPVMAQEGAARALGLKPEQVTINNHLIGGGFGRRLEVDGVVKVARIAQHVEGPVKIVWSREEDIQQELFRPIYHDRLRARVENGRITAWHHRVTGPSIMARWLPPAFQKGIDPDAVDGAIEQPYDFDHILIEYIRHETPQVPVAFWRGVGPNSNIFSAERFINHIAHQTGVDPVEFRRGMLKKSPRALAVLNLAAEKAGWGQPLAAPSGGGRAGRGIALLAGFGSFLACVAEVVVPDDGDVQIKRIVCAADVGKMINPNTLEAQVQGGTIFGMSAILHGEITIDHGRVLQSNFHDYRVLRIDEMPRIETYFVPSEEKPGGIGEPGTVVVQPAIANAVFDATGVQLKRMPINRALLAKGAKA